MDFTNWLWEVVINWTNAGVKCCNVLHYRQVGDVGPETVAPALAGAVNTNILAVMADMMSTSVSFQNLTVQRLGPGIPLVAQEFAPAQFSGNAAGQALPNNVALCFTKRSLLAGRKYRGRFYLGGLSEADTNGNIFLVANYPFVLLNFLVGLKSTFAGSLVPVITGRKFNDARTSWHGVDISDVVLRDPRVDTQRRRLE